METFKKVMTMEEGTELLFITDGDYISLRFCIFAYKDSEQSLGLARNIWWLRWLRIEETVSSFCWRSST